MRNFCVQNAGVLTLLGPAYSSVSKDQRGGTMSWSWAGLGFQLLLEMTPHGMICFMQKDS